ncbi:unnamed protein product [Trichogramma brassicae]|uniref:Uncharacterized protein n=1 Tax=Trichogramma brassicae TaxID=86971 RepID=A0A6H5I772_9HYME|nr:unnamed protein product [Trichogramma brassicae]
MYIYIENRPPGLYTTTSETIEHTGHSQTQNAHHRIQVSLLRKLKNSLLRDREDSTTRINRLSTEEDDSLKTNNYVLARSCSINSGSSSGISSCQNETLCAFVQKSQAADGESFCSSSTDEIIELRSLNETVLHHHESPEDDENIDNNDDVFETRRAFCYTPERLVRSQQYRIVSSTPPCQPSFDSLWPQARREFDRNYQNCIIDAVQRDYGLVKAADVSAHDSPTNYTEPSTIVQKISLTYRSSTISRLITRYITQSLQIYVKV